MLPGSPSSPCSRCLPLLSEDSLQNLSSSFTLSQKTRSPNQKSPSFLLFPSFPLLFGPTSTQNILPCNLLCHPPTPLWVLGGWCHHSPNWHGYCQLHSHVSCAAAVSRSRSPTSYALLRTLSENKNRGGGGLQDESNFITESYSFLSIFANEFFFLKDFIICWWI